MKRLLGNFLARFLISYISLTSALLVYGSARAQGIENTNLFNSNSLLSSVPRLSDDEKLPCEALICLSSSSGNALSQCAPAISAFNSINALNWSDTFQDRLNWLKKCPTVTDNPDMTNLAVAIVNGSLGCDSATLNRVLRAVIGGCGGDCGTLGKVEISNSMPGYCSAYYNNPYIQGGISRPVYVGTPQTGGFWTDPTDLQAAQAQYQAKLEAMQAAQFANEHSPGGN